MSSAPMNCFLLYCQDYRALLTISNPGLSNAEITSMLGEKWRNLDPSIKKHYTKTAKKLRDVRESAFF